MRMINFNIHLLIISCSSYNRGAIRRTPQASDELVAELFDTCLKCSSVLSLPVSPVSTGDSLIAKEAEIQDVLFSVSIVTG